jgi:predicted N-formylglutamate amidohydrolase
MKTAGSPMRCLRQPPRWVHERVFRNYPYGPADGVTHTLKRHGLTREIANVMLEIRNDLISDDAGQQQWAGQIAELLAVALERLKTEGGRLDA